MKAIEIVTALQGKKGQHVQAVWARKMKTRGEFSVSIVKRTEAWVRTGIKFANLKSVAEGIEQGTRAEVGKLPFGTWRKGFENLIIDHTPKGQTESVEYVRLYPATFDNLKTPKVEYFMDGVPATWEQIEPYLLARDNREVETFTLRAENVIEIAGD
jgi:hypothetical protein